MADATPRPMFYVGLTIVSASLLSFSLMSWRQPSRGLIGDLAENCSLRTVGRSRL